MAKLDLSLTDEDLRWAEAQVQSGAFASIDDYIASLVHADMDEETRLQRLRNAVNRGRGSGISSRSLKDIYDDFLSRRNAA